MEDSPIGVADVHRLLGRARGAARDPESFVAERRLEQFGEVAVERLTTTTIRVTPAPVVRQESAAIALLRVLRGALHISREGQRVRVGEGESVLMLSTRPYEFVLEEGEYTQVLLPLRLFAPEVVVNVLAAIDAPSPPSALSSLVWGVFESLVEAPPGESARDSDVAAIEELAAMLITQLATRDFPDRPAAAGMSTLLTVALTHIEGNLRDHTLDLEAIAKAAGTSPRTLNREFRSIGMTPMGALRGARLAAVAQRLSSRGSVPSLEALAREYGYADRTALTRAFHRRFGRSPSEYRARTIPFPA